MALYGTVHVHRKKGTEIKALYCILPLLRACRRIGRGNAFPAKAKKVTEYLGGLQKSFYICTAKERNLAFAQMAESVDALVSNTSGFTSMPVRPRLWVPLKEVII